jgi:sialate O-acetylesterase
VLPVGSGQALGTYQAMIHPVVPYGLRGFLWYQGESNVGEGMLYTLKMQALIQGWRKQFGVPEAPFLFVQLAPYNYGDPREGALQALWVAQQHALKFPRTGMAVTMDIGNPADIHPRNKSEVGRRLALWALADTYGKQDLVKSGPLFEGFAAAGDAIRVRFQHAASGLATRDGKEPSHFEVAGPDWNFKPAKAEIAGSEIVLKSDQVAQPVMARYAWYQKAEPNLMNKDGLPAAAFHTHWPDDPVLGRNVAFQKSFTSSDPNKQGWNAGLTDGNWTGGAGSCFATGDAPAFPKHVTIDLGRTRDVQAVRFGVPDFGATKTVVISVSPDGKEFQEIGKHEFAAKTRTGTEIRFDKRPVRFVRATFPDHHDKQDQYSGNHGFLTELEAYGPAQ